MLSRAYFHAGDGEVEAQAAAATSRGGKTAGGAKTAGSAKGGAGGGPEDVAGVPTEAWCKVARGTSSADPFTPGVRGRGGSAHSTPRRQGVGGAV